ncbi:hypothetical protein N7465_004051 [Penicillium sp. CMV-2018d]|nr:hypothetical protein N7465_004051 [Penicillium sp. CMV-2018d]
MTGPIAHGVVMQLTGHIIGVLSDPTLAATLQPWRISHLQALGKRMLIRAHLSSVMVNTSTDINKTTRSEVSPEGFKPESSTSKAHNGYL